MGRFSLSPRGGRCFHDEDDHSTCTESDESSIEYSSDEEDYPHPLGFTTYGKTRFFLDPPQHETTQQIRRRLRVLDTKHDFLDTELEETNLVQSFPPLSQYTDAKTAPTEALLRYSALDELPEREDSIDRVIALLSAASLIENESPSHSRLKSESRQAGQRLRALCQASERERQSIRRRMDAEKLQLTKQHRDAADALRMLLKRDHEAAQKVIRAHQAQEEAREEADRLQREQENRVKEERQRIKDERERMQQEEEEQRNEAIREKEKVAAAEQAKKTEHVVKAKKLVAKLEDLRASILPFEKSKNVSRRRLNMKKTVKGKVNTLSQDDRKIELVANEVIMAVQQAKEEDEQLKQQVQAGNTQITSEMTRGKRYLVDLLASDTMARVQADQFNGTRGDGFPLACMLAKVSTEVKELVPILAAHIYTVCPTAIPTLPKPSKDASEEELMESLGMAKGKDGQFETFERFLARTESIISLVADIMSVLPDNHVLLGGHKGAIDWLERFLSLLPPSPEIMPLLTAPVLDAFLVGAGHMLASKYPEEFKKHLGTILDDIVSRLDEGPIGAPSALRLKKVVQKGFDHFKTTLSSKAIASLYNAPYDSADGPSGLTTKPFGSVGGSSVTSTPFGGASASSSGGGGSNFGVSGGTVAPTESPFGADPVGQNASSNQAPQSNFSGSSNPFGSTSFGAGPKDSSPFGANAHESANIRQAPQSNLGGNSLFGAFGTSQGPGAQQSPFGPPASQNISSNQQPQSNLSVSIPFGSTPSGMGSTSTSTMPAPFGMSSAPTPAQSSFDITPFGSSGGSATNASRFGQPSSQTAQSPFGVSIMPFGTAGQNNMNTSSAPTPFGTSATSTSAQSSFGSTPFGSNAPIPSPFGNKPAIQSTPSPFGASSMPFGNSYQSMPSNQAPQSSFGKASFGVSGWGGAVNQPPQSIFGNSPFGSSSGGAMNISPFGPPSGQNASSSFGASPFSSSIPFANSSGSFGGGQQQTGGAFGYQGGGNKNADKKEPCKFFDQGRCSFGDNCRFSHDTGSGGGGFRANTSDVAFGGGTVGNAFGSQGGGSAATSKKEPCKFFAQGRCQFGDNCRFSHDATFGGGGFGGNSADVGNSLFGGPRR